MSTQAKLLLVILLFQNRGENERTSSAEIIEDGITLECQPWNMTLYVNASNTMYANDTIRFFNTTCTGYRNESHFIVSTNYQDCGTSHYVINNTLIAFKNTAIIERYIAPGELLMRKHHVDKRIEMRCSLPSYIVVRSGNVLLEGDEYGPWSPYSACTASCDGGVQMRNRICRFSNETKCIGNSTQSRKCNTNACQQTCDTLKCTDEFTECVESFNSSEPATCNCKIGTVRENGKCKTFSNIVVIINLRLGITYMEQFNDLKNPSTVKLKTRLEIDLHGTLLLLSNEYVVVTRFRAGSVLVDFMVLLTRNSTDNKVTIQEKLNTEIEFNRTGHLEKYFPVAGQVVNISETNLCQLGSDSCNKTSSSCQPNPGIGFNFRCNCKTGYRQETNYTCISSSSKDSTSEELRLVLIIVLIGLFVLLFFVGCFVAVRRRRQRALNEEATDVVDSGMVVHNDSIFEGVSRFSRRKMRAYSVYNDHSRIETTKYRDIPEENVFGQTFRT